MDTSLDNPAWCALTTAQAAFAVPQPAAWPAQTLASARQPTAEGAAGSASLASGSQYATARALRYQPGILPFVGLVQPDAAAAAELDPLMAAGETFYIIGEMPPHPKHWTLELELPCAQLLAPQNLHCMPQPTVEITLLGEPDKEEMYQLISAVQPGYYHPDSRRLGDYCGIRRDGKLVAMAGERMRLTRFSELSAICTHPDYTGHGYAQQLIGWLCRRQVAAGITPFLHVALVNERALRLYIHLGFRHRREIVFRRIRKNEAP